MSDDDKQETAAEPAEDATAMPEAAAEQDAAPPPAWEPPPPDDRDEAAMRSAADIPPLDHTGDSLPSHDPHWSAIKKWMRRELALLMSGVHDEGERREMNP